MRPHPSLAIALSLLVAACGDAATTSSRPTTSVETATSEAETTTVPPMTRPATSSTTTRPAPTTTAVRTPSTEAWGSWTLILASVETGTAGGEDAAREIAAGVDGAEVIWSDDFPSLHPGYWVVHRGRFTSGREASAWCADIPDDLSCYPRFLGPDVSPLAAAGHALVVDGDALVAVDTTSGERRKVIDPYFTGDGRFVGSLALTPDGTSLFYGVTSEDSWFSCESARGLVERMRLEFGTASETGPGWGPAVSPDGRWLAVLDSGQCLPDPDRPNDWVLTPADTVALYVIEEDAVTRAGTWSTTVAPASYEDPQTLTWLGWRDDSARLLVANRAGSIFELNIDGPIDAGAPLLEEVDGTPQALVGDTLYVVRDETPEEWGGFDLVAVDLASGAEGEVITQTVGWTYAAADTTGSRLIWGSDTQVGTAESSFGLEHYLGGLAW